MTQSPWAHLRQEYSQAGLLESDLAADPMDQLEAWLRQAQAANVAEPNAMTLATCAPDGAPSARVVLLKGLDARGLVFFTNYTSHKARDMEHEPRVALTLVWLELERQVRVTGTVARVTPEESAAYFATRPRGSQLGAWASHQSEVVADRAALEAQLVAAEARFDGRDVPVPEHWGGYRVAPRTVEFWQGRRNRLHDRLRYSAAAGTWRIERLSP
jgi:pyridoxamine 5'-phosphate oxidase